MKTVRELIKEAESKLDDEHKDVNVPKVRTFAMCFS